MEATETEKLQKIIQLLTDDIENNKVNAESTAHDTMRAYYRGRINEAQISRSYIQDMLDD